MSTPTREQILDALNRVSGNPDSGIVHDLQPSFADAILELLQAKPKHEHAVLPTPETRTTDNK